MPEQVTVTLERAELEATIATVECSDPVEEIQEIEESALAKFRAALSDQQEKPRCEGHSDGGISVYHEGCTCQSPEADRG